MDRPAVLLHSSIFRIPPCSDAPVAYVLPTIRQYVEVVDRTVDMHWLFAGVDVYRVFGWRCGRSIPLPARCPHNELNVVLVDEIFIRSIVPLRKYCQGGCEWSVVGQRACS